MSFVAYCFVFLLILQSVAGQGEGGGRFEDEYGFGVGLLCNSSMRNCNCSITCLEKCFLVGGYIGFILDILTLSFFGLESDKDFQG
jgi:hypothetical protein